MSTVPLNEAIRLLLIIVLLIEHTLYVQLSILRRMGLDILHNNRCRST